MPCKGVTCQFLFLALLPFLSVTSSWAQSPLPSEAYDLSVSKGLVEFELKRYDSAEKFFRRALEAKPDDPRATFYLGQALTRNRKYKEAETVFRKLITTEPSSGRGPLGLGIVLYNQRRYREALDSLARAETLSPNEALVYYYQGLSYFQLAEYEQTPPRFDRAMTLGPDLSSSAHYYSGLAYYQLGTLEEVRAELEAVRKLEPESEFGKSAATILERIKAGVPIKGRKMWDLIVNVSSQWDDNVVLLPGGFSPPAGATGISRSSDYRTAFSLRGEVRAIEQGPFAAGANYSLYQSFHRVLSGFDVESHTPGAFLQYTVGPVQTRLQYFLDYVKVGREEFLVAHSFAPLITIRESPTFFTQIQLRYQDLDFRNDRFSFNSFRSGHDWLAGATQYLVIANNSGHLRIGYNYDRYITAGKDVSVATSSSAADWAYQGHRVAAGFSLPPFYKITLDGGVDYYIQRYDNANSFSPGGTVFRSDKIYNYYATVTRKLTDNFSLAFQYLHTYGDSNLVVFNYRRNIYGLVLTGQF